MGLIINGNEYVTNSQAESSRNIGDIFYTTRLDNELNGAVECNGSQYNFADINGGDNNIQSLLENGKLPYITIDEFDAMVSEQGGCDSFGWKNSSIVLYAWEEGTDNIIYTTSPLESVSSGDNVYNSNKDIIGTVSNVIDSASAITYNPLTRVPEPGYYYYSSDNDIYETETTTYFKVPKKLGRVLVRSQKPTADNNYTWFNLYSDGWVEQGGTVKGGFAQSTNWNYRNVSLPIEMIDNSYINTFQATWNFSYGGQVGQDKVYATTSSTATTMQWAYILVSSATTMFVNWQVSGYANSAEYTRDKWDYQNVQVERPMIQLFNGSTDTALATCTSVLTDVSSLKSYDYVVETQEASDSNNYTWYRLYKNGWVEQGGYFVATSGTNEISLPVQMKGIYKTYSAKVNACVDSSDARNAQILSSSSSTILKVITNSQFDIYWEVKGMSNR